MSSIALKVTRAPSTSGVHHAPEGVKPLFRGNGGTDYVCGNCAAVIASDFIFSSKARVSDQEK